MKKWIALLLCLVLAVSTLSGCELVDEVLGKLTGGDSIVGTWEAEVDFAEYLTDTMASELGEMASYFDFQDLTLKLVLTFEEDGTYTLSGDKASAEKLFSDLLEQLKPGMVKYLEEQLKASGMEMTVDELLAMSGTTMDALMEQSFSEEMIDEMLEDMESDGEYEIDGDLLYLDGDECEFKLKGDALTIDSDDAGDVAFLFPLELERVE